MGILRGLFIGLQITRQRAEFPQNAPPKPMAQTAQEPLTPLSDQAIMRKNVGRM
jgi:hypothetical protein